MAKEEARRLAVEEARLREEKEARRRAQEERRRVAREAAARLPKPGSGSHESRMLLFQEAARVFEAAARGFRADREHLFTAEAGLAEELKAKCEAVDDKSTLGERENKEWTHLGAEEDHSLVRKMWVAARLAYSPVVRQDLGFSVISETLRRRIDALPNLEEAAAAAESESLQQTVLGFSVGYDTIGMTPRVDTGVPDLGTGPRAEEAAVEAAQRAAAAAEEALSAAKCYSPQGAEEGPSLFMYSDEDLL